MKDIMINSRFIIYLLLIGQLFVGCQKEEQVFFLQEKNLPDIEKHEKQWEQKKPKRYCIGLFNSNIHYENHFDVCVSEGVITSIKEKSTQTPVELNHKEAITIENIFQFLKATNNSRFSGEIKIKNFEIDFDKELSYPEMISFKFKKPKEGSYKKVLIELKLIVTSNFIGNLSE
jgi:hypothetical protein